MKNLIALLAMIFASNVFANNSKELSLELMHSVEMNGDQDQVEVRLLDSNGCFYKGFAQLDIHTMRVKLQTQSKSCGASVTLIESYAMDKNAHLGLTGHCNDIYISQNGGNKICMRASIKSGTKVNMVTL